VSIRTTVTLDDDVLDRVKRESRSRGASFGDTLNDLLRKALSPENRPQRRTLEIKPVPMGYRTGLNYDDVESLFQYGKANSIGDDPGRQPAAVRL
jgi:plasmid stability protein